MKHVGKMKNNSARVVVAYRTLPGDPYSALVVGTNGLPDSHHDALMSLVEDVSGQNTNELAEILSARRFPDGTNMLEYLHTNGHLKKVPTRLVLMTPTAKQQIPLDELNQLIADQKGVSLDELAITDGSGTPVKTKPSAQEVPAKEIVVTEDVPMETMTAKELRSKADALYKQAQKFRKRADELDPPKRKTKPENLESI